MMPSGIGPKHFSRTIQSLLGREVAGSLYVSFCPCEASPPCVPVVVGRVGRRSACGREGGVACDETEEGRTTDCPGGEEGGGGGGGGGGSREEGRWRRGRGGGDNGQSQA